MDSESIMTGLLALAAGAGATGFFVRRRKNRAEICDKLNTQFGKEGINFTASVFRAIGEGSILKAGRAIKTLYDKVTDPDEFKAMMQGVRLFQIDKMLGDPGEAKILIEKVRAYEIAQAAEQVKTAQSQKVGGVSIENVSA